jgi:hypothetical protein
MAGRGAAAEALFRRADLTPSLLSRSSSDQRPGLEDTPSPAAFAKGPEFSCNQPAVQVTPPVGRRSFYGKALTFLVSEPTVQPKEKSVFDLF